MLSGQNNPEQPKDSAAVPPLTHCLPVLPNHFLLWCAFSTLARLRFRVWLRMEMEKLLLSLPAFLFWEFLLTVSTFAWLCVENSPVWLNNSGAKDALLHQATGRMGKILSLCWGKEHLASSATKHTIHISLPASSTAKKGFSTAAPFLPFLYEGKNPKKNTNASTRTHTLKRTKTGQKSKLNSLPTNTYVLSRRFLSPFNCENTQVCMV